MGPTGICERLWSVQREKREGETFRFAHVVVTVLVDGTRVKEMLVEVVDILEHVPII
jgi:hypothetical protein